MNDTILRELHSPILELTKIPQSGHLISRHLIENKVIPVAGGLFGELNPHFSDDLYGFSRFTEVNLLSAAFRINKVYITQTKEDECVTAWVAVDILDTPCGRIMNDAINNGHKVKFSLRYMADTTEIEGFTIIREDGYNLITIDAYVYE